MYYSRYIKDNNNGNDGYVNMKEGKGIRVGRVYNMMILMCIMEDIKSVTSC